MKVLIIEDEKPAADNIAGELRLIDEYIDVVGICNSITESVYWFQTNPLPDLILMDVHLPDGLSFNIFKSISISCPVIYITAYDKYLTEAFEYNSIDYLLKPIDEDRLKSAIKKYKNLQSHFLHNHVPLSEYFSRLERRKSRILVKHGTEFQTIKVEDIVYFYTEHKLIFLVDRDGRKYLVEIGNLTELQEELDDKFFYRVNRKYIINANFLKRFKGIEGGKISLELALPVNEEIVVSQDNSTSFKKWINEV